VDLPGLLVDAAWLHTHLGEPRLRVFDCTTHLAPDPITTFRAESARADWERGHVPGAAYIDLQGTLSDPASGLRFTMPSAERFAEAMSALGVGDDSRVVLYSATSSWWATRVWWMLRAFGFDRAAVLDGGWEKWTAEGRPICTAPCAYPRARFVARPRPLLLANKDEVLAATHAADVAIVNALTRQQHTGEGGVHYGRPGHIPSSVNVPYSELIDRETNTFRPPAEMRAILERAGVLSAGRVITYCGGGIAATGVAFALALLGRQDVAVYDGSLSEWCADPSLKMATGE
jgi:thiosulfate/3-mercaptopyruvate sulfurtransferase